jgi:16S rRNA G527 N7-methylase RsmG
VKPEFQPKSYWENRIQINFNLKGVGDIGLPETYNHRLYDIRRYTFRRALKSISLDAAKARVLDVGSGTGFYIQQW